MQGRTQLEAVRCVRSISDVRVLDRMGDPDEVIDGADIVIAATTSKTPVFDGSKIASGTHVTGVGSVTTEMREVDAALVMRARVVVDQREAILAEAGDIVGPISDGMVDESVISAEIGEIVLGAHPGRTSSDEITFFKSVGNAVQDIAVAAMVLERAEAAGRGVVVEL